MQYLKLIKVTDEPVSALKSYLKKMRANASSAPDLDEIYQLPCPCWKIKKYKLLSLQLKFFNVGTTTQIFDYSKWNVNCRN